MVSAGLFPSLGLERRRPTCAECWLVGWREPCPGVDGASSRLEPRPPTGAPLLAEVQFEFGGLGRRFSWRSVALIQLAVSAGPGASRRRRSRRKAKRERRSARRLSAIAEASSPLRARRSKSL